MEERTVHIPTLMCGGCAGLVRGEVESLDGVESANVIVDARTLTVTWRAPATWEAIREALGSIGHPADE